MKKVLYAWKKTLKHGINIQKTEKTKTLVLNDMFFIEKQIVQFFHNVTYLMYKLLHTLKVLFVAKTGAL